ncbi:MAG: archease [Deltaproteobacteria bacterium]|nr:archease [Deltaproteobacteria bacterium]
MNERAEKYTVLDHTADLGIEVHGSDLQDLFRNAALALMDLMIKDESKDRAMPKEISVSGQDLPDLMVRWLGEILYLFEGEGLVVKDITIAHMDSFNVNALLYVTPFDPNSHEILCEIKAVTYHQIQVRDLGDRCEARIIFDL